MENQGRSQRQIESNEKVMVMGCVLMFVVILGLIIYGIVV